MSERNKKYLIVLLLLGACLASTFLLAYSSESAVKTLNNLAEADSLLRRDLETFNIPDRQIKEQTVRIDSLNKRKEYQIRVPQGFSKTQLHHEIHNTFSQYNVASPAKVIFPEKDFNIYLQQNNSIFTTIRLRTDPDLIMKRGFGSILIAFDSMPSENLLDQINILGEPISIVLMIDDPDRADDLKQNLKESYSNILFWLKDQEGDNMLRENSAASFSLPKLQHLQREAPDTGVLSFFSLDNEKNTNLLESLSGTTLDYIDVSDAVLLHTNMGKTAFKQELSKFSRQALRGEYPIAIVMGEEESLNWLQEELAEFKKSGLTIIPPKRKRFSND